MIISQQLAGNKLFWINKRMFDVLVSLLLLPLLFVIAMILPLINYFFNSGNLFFVQDRMGKNCNAFSAIKFRTMVPIKEITRKYDDPIETSRITSFGNILRKSRIDELPQILNVLKGEMSLIGPRPDYYIHALEYLKNVQGYRERHIIRPGITGLSQIRLGYIEGLEATAKKATIDNYYIQNVGYIIELKIIFNTLIIILRGMGK
ncbi:sugar transferase [Amylibacter sp.]|jgi:lipopolysaccharide/colanic/teichoic acid biosynthesis glycosyltransferase|nr:sugar transferase [Amylibacter sp.]